MAFRVGVGESDFADLRKSGKYYVDKTDIMYELVEEAENKVTLFTRPRRFGKTLMMSMMSNFFSITKDSKEIFEGLGITERKEFCEKWMNQYPVLFVSFKDVEAETFEGAYKMLKTRLADVCKEWDSLLREAMVNSADNEIFNKLMFKTAEEDEVKKMLSAADRKDKADVIKEWYDGYVFGDSFVYCPWDVINYMSALKKRENAKPKNYWKNTSHNGILLSFVKRTDFKVKGKFEILMNGGTIVQTISD